MIESLRLAGKYNPFDATDRGASARQMAIVAITLEPPNRDWLLAARSEIIIALKTDYSSADLMIKLMAVDLRLGLEQESQLIYSELKRVNPNSPVVRLVDEQNRQKLAAPSPAIPDGNRSNQHD